MPETNIGVGLAAAGCVSLLLTVAIVAGVVWAAVRVTRARNAKRRGRWGTLMRALRLEDLGGTGARVLGGTRDGTRVEVVIDSVADGEAMLALLVIGAGDPQPTRWATRVEARIDPPLPVSLAVIDTRSSMALDPMGSALPGAENPMADAVHEITCDARERAIALLIALGRTPYDAIEARGWRVSFDAARVRLERDGAIDDPATLDEGIALALRLIARLHAAAGTD